MYRQVEGKQSTAGTRMQLSRKSPQLLSILGTGGSHRPRDFLVAVDSRVAAFEAGA